MIALELDVDPFVFFPLFSKVWYSQFNHHKVTVLILRKMAKLILGLGHKKRLKFACAHSEYRQRVAGYMTMFICHNNSGP